MPEGTSSFASSGAECATVFFCERAAGLPRQEHTKLQVLVLLLCFVYQPRVAPWECVCSAVHVICLPSWCREA